jgi:hypothetical protein
VCVGASLGGWVRPRFSDDVRRCEVRVLALTWPSLHQGYFDVLLVQYFDKTVRCNFIDFLILIVSKIFFIWIANSMVEYSAFKFNYDVLHIWM